MYRRDNLSEQSGSCIVNFQPTLNSRFPIIDFSRQFLKHHGAQGNDDSKLRWLFNGERVVDNFRGNGLKLLIKIRVSLTGEAEFLTIHQ